MPKSNLIPHPRRRITLPLRRVSLPAIARKYDVRYQTLYAVLTGTRPGRDPRVRRAAAEARRALRQAAREVIGHE